MFENRPKVINLVAGFDPENPLNDDLERAAREVGYELKRITHVDSAKIRSGDLEDVFSDNVLWRRELDGNTSEENDLIWKWLDEHKKRTMNTHVIGGRIQPIDKYFQQVEIYAKTPGLCEHMVPSFLAHSTKDLVGLVDDGRVRFPLVLKPRYGSLGKGIELILDMREILTAAARVKNFDALLVEPYIDAECDYRVFVIGGKALGVMGKKGREGLPGDFEAKSAGVLKWNEPKDSLFYNKLVRIAELAARTLKLEYAGVDLLREKGTNNIYILETNLSAGWNNGFSQVTGVDVAKKIVEYFAA